MIDYPTLHLYAMSFNGQSSHI